MTLIILTLISVTILGIVAALRWKHVHHSYYPFLISVILGGINEIFSFILIYQFHAKSNFINNNIFVLLESILIVLFFRNLPSFKKYYRLLNYVLIGLAGFWIFENLVQNKILGVSFYFRIIYSFVIVLLSITYINKLLGSVRTNIFRNADFLICSAMILYFTYKILVEMFWLYGLTSSRTFLTMVYSILIYLNLFCNLIYTIAIIWMPRKQIFTVPS